MGMPPLISRSSFDRPCPEVRAVSSPPVRITPTPGNPDPWNWRVLNWEVINGYLSVMAHYPDATSFEGIKIMVFEKGVTIEDLEAQEAVDPHFSEDKAHHHPIARFEPTKRGWDHAWRFCQVARTY